MDASNKRYKIIDFEGETLEDGFISYGSAYHYLLSLFTPEHIRNMGLIIVRYMEGDNE